MIKERWSRVALSLIAIVLTFWALKATRPVSLPLAAGIVLLLFFRPLQKRLDRRFSRTVSVVGIVTIVLVFLGFLAGLVYYSLATVAPQLPEYAEQLRSRFQGVTKPLGFSGGGTELAGNVLPLFGDLFTSLSLLALTLTVLIFLLIEVDGFRNKLHSSSFVDERVLNAISQMSGKFERYFLVQAFTSVLTGLLTYFYCLVVGLEFAFVWGVVAFAFNFVPTLGSVLAVVPPTLFAVAFGGLAQAALVLVGLAFIQLALGNFVDPALQGRALELSPVVVLLAVVFWGWLWGIGGAIIAVPLTVALTLLLHEFKTTRPIAVFLAEPGSPQAESGGGEPQTQ